MVRDLEFRAYLKDKYCRTWPRFKDIFSGRMLEVKSVHFGTGKIIVSYKFGNLSINFDDIELMQFTGELDLKGKKIWEGDILHQEYYSDWVVVWKDFGFHIYNACNPQTFYPLVRSDRKVIGNIYEGILPEFLTNKI